MPCVVEDGPDSRPFLQPIVLVPISKYVTEELHGTSQSNNNRESSRYSYLSPGRPPHMRGQKAD